MKKIFIAYGDFNCTYSLKRIGKQARALKVFDEVLLYTPDDLPSYILSSPLMKYSYGGGYWAWKPCIISETLKKVKEDDVVCYVDAGCSLRKGIEWTIYFELMKKYDMLCFEYRDEYPEWEKFGCTSTRIKHWAKKKTLLFLNDWVRGCEWQEHNKILGGILFFKGKNNPILKDWITITVNHPEVVLDPNEEEMCDQYPYFALHKHDQAILVALTSLYRKNCLVMPETMETCGERVAIFASRIRAGNRRAYLGLMMKYWGRMFLGDKIFDGVKYLLRR